MTSLIDVIFLLLLFFMLTSTFTRFAEVEFSAAGAGGSTGETRPVFLRLGVEEITLNGVVQTLEALPEALRASREAPDLPVIVALAGPVSAQRLTDLLVVLRGLDGLRVTVLGAT